MPETEERFAPIWTEAHIYETFTWPIDWAQELHALSLEMVEAWRNMLTASFSIAMPDEDEGADGD